jgi:hypothetical protein
MQAISLQVVRVLQAVEIELQNTFITEKKLEFLGGLQLLLKHLDKDEWGSTKWEYVSNSDNLENN